MAKRTRKTNPFDWEGCMDKVSRQPGIYSPGGVCAAAERRKVMGRNPGDQWTVRTYEHRKPYRQWAIAGYNDAKSGAGFTAYQPEWMWLEKVPKAYKDNAKKWFDKGKQAGVALLRKSEREYYQYWNSIPPGLDRRANPDELETVFSPESVASKLTLATAVPGAAVAMTAIELAHAVDAGLVDETAAVLMRPAEEVAEAVVGVSNPRKKRSDYLRDMDKPTVMGYELDRVSLAPKRSYIPTKSGGDYGADPIGGGMFRMVPSGDIVNLDERNRRLERNPRRNPSTDADAMYESFHGQPPTETVEVVEELREHGHLATLGTLVELKLQSMAGKDVSIEWTKDNPYLASNEHGTQLYIVGGDQTVDLKAMGMAGDKWEREHMVLGVCHEVTYRTRKGFDKFRLVDYYHNLGEETGVQPMLAYDTVNDKLSIVGGQYAVKPEGIVN